MSRTVDQKILARHVLVDFYNCPPTLLMFAIFLETLMKDAAEVAGCKIIGSKSHQFTPCGASAFVLVAESHISIHSWPEKGAALVDIFLSGNVNIEAAINLIEKRLEAKSKKIIMVERG